MIVDAYDRKFGDVGSSGVTPVTVIPLAFPCSWTCVASPTPYGVLSLATATRVQPSCFIATRPAWPWMVSRGTIRRYVRLPVG